MDPLACFYQIKYTDFFDELRYTLNINRFRNLSESRKNVLMQAFIRVLCRHSEYLPTIQNTAHITTLEQTPSSYSGHTITKFKKSLKEIQMKTHRSPMSDLIKIELSCLPSSDFIYSQNPINIPDFYKTKNEIPEAQTGIAAQQFPVNILLGNVNIFKYFNAIRYLGQPPSVSSPAPQVPVQSYITYLWGAAIDQYYQVALQNNLL